MGRRVLLISVNQYDFPNPVFPLGLAHVEAALRRAGHETRVVDLNVDSSSLAGMAAEFKPDLVGLSLRNIDDTLIRNRRTFFEVLTDVCRHVRGASAAPIVLGGSGFSIFPERLLRLSGADFGIHGEGERPLLGLLEALHRGEDYCHIAGLVYRDGDRVIVNPRDERTAAAEIEIPERSAELVEFYLRRSSMLNVQTQRGCALKCCYCTYPLLEGRAYRRRPPERVGEELAELQRLGARYVFIVDSVFNTSPAHVHDLCEEILRRGLTLHWGCFLRPQHLTADLMKLMARAGLRHVEFGSDSLCDEVLDAYGKHLTFEDIRHSSELARRENVAYAHFLICGGPGETRDTLRTSFENAKTLPGAIIMARVGMRVYPGTPLFDRLHRERPDLNGLDLLAPHYYLTPALTENDLFEELRQFARQSPNWIIDDPPPEYFAMAERLRVRGTIGPLWSYLAILQRWGNSLAGAATPPAPNGT
jgi:radical SAM superfamily enzyme YgiQ (UPF0313 family)